MKLIAAIFIAGTLLTTCEKQNTEEDQSLIDFSSNKKAAALIEADNIFALDLFSEIQTVEGSDNYMISPLSVAMALGMTYNGADGDTKSAFEETLRLQGLKSHEINRIHSALIGHLLSIDPGVIMEIANSIWVDQSFNLRKEFADTNRHYYNAEINSLDFDNPGSVDIINNWVNDKTHEKITKVIESIPPLTAMYLINAIYFYGTWKYVFDEDDNMPIYFNYEDGNTEEVEGMMLQEDLSYHDAHKFRIAELPYGNDKFSMLILLPKPGYELFDIKEEMNIKNWNEWIESLQRTELKLQMPKFSFEYKILLNDVLKDMGLGVAFSDKAEFPLMVEESDDLYISRVIHKTFVDVNEKGTEAAAVTAVEVGVTSVGPGNARISFIVDRPFFFVIREKTSNAMVFMGKVGKPEYN